MWVLHSKINASLPIEEGRVLHGLNDWRSLTYETREHVVLSIKHYVVKFEKNRHDSFTIRSITYIYKIDCYNVFLVFRSSKGFFKMLVNLLDIRIKRQLVPISSFSVLRTKQNHWHILFTVWFVFLVRILTGFCANEESKTLQPTLRQAHRQSHIKHTATISSPN